jgi:2-methylisocitrate lyase-like PEP mutase family enzyme
VWLKLQIDRAESNLGDARGTPGRYLSTLERTRAMSKGSKLRELMAEKRVVPLLGAPTAMHVQIMEMCGTETAFIGTNRAMRNYTGLPDMGLVTMTESLDAARHMCRAVSIPLILDGDTGHGGIPAVQRLVEESIAAGLAGVLIDDQPTDGKRRTQMAGIELEDREHVVAKYRAAVDRRDRLDKDFVILSQCYAGNAINNSRGIDEVLDRLSLYETEGGVDWILFEAPHSINEIKQARGAMSGCLSVLSSHLDKALTLEDHSELGLQMAWYGPFPSNWLNAACWDAMQRFSKNGIRAWEEFCAENPENPFATDLRDIVDSLAKGYMLAK